MCRLECHRVSPGCLKVLLAKWNYFENVPKLVNACRMEFKVAFNLIDLPCKLRECANINKPPKNKK